MSSNFTTDRLFLSPMTLDDAAFVFELVNTPGWLQFIGDRQVYTLEAATAYIQRITTTPNANNWVVRLKTTETPVGVISFLQRDYLDHRDIGFAFLPPYNGQGYAFEAASAVMQGVAADHPRILATVLPDNPSSIKLLEKLGLRFEKEILLGEETLLLFAISMEKVLIDQLVAAFFGIFTNARQQAPNWERIHQLCLPEALIVKKTGLEQEVYNLQTFITPRKKILSDGTLTEFEEKETAETTTITGNIAQRFSVYQKSGYLNGSEFQQQGHKLFQFAKTEAGWKISAVIWEDEV